MVFTILLLLGIEYCPNSVLLRFPSLIKGGVRGGLFENAQPPPNLPLHNVEESGTQN